MKDTKYKAVNAFIFAGSFSIGVMKAGFDLKEVLEISDEMIHENAFFFKKNYPDIPVIIPSEWENDQYLDNLKLENIDIMCCNCPCSSLSRINRWASVEGKNNRHFYRLFNIFEHVQSKTFVVENAPTLIKIGKPILNDMINKLSNLYRFTILRDFAGNHNVPMKRLRTMIVGWRKDVFDKIPILEQDAKPMMTIKDTIGDMYDSQLNDDKSPAFDCLSSLYKYAIPHNGIMASLAKRVYAGEEPAKTEIMNVISKTKEIKYINHILKKLETGAGYWDKTPKRMLETDQFPSFSGPQEYLHPIQNRTLNTIELKRIMGYPDDFIVEHTKEECKIPIRQALAQGVPVNFGKWIAEQVKKGLDGELDLDDSNADVIFQHHNEHKYSTFSIDEFLSLDELKINKKDYKKLTK